MVRSLSTRGRAQPRAARAARGESALKRARAIGREQQRYGGRMVVDAVKLSRANGVMRAFDSAA